MPFLIEDVAVSQNAKEKQLPFASAHIVQFGLVYPRGIARSQRLLGTRRHNGALWLINYSGSLANFPWRDFGDSTSSEGASIKRGSLAPIINRIDNLIGIRSYLIEHILRF